MLQTVALRLPKLAQPSLAQNPPAQSAYLEAETLRRDGSRQLVSWAIKLASALGIAAIFAAIFFVLLHFREAVVRLGPWGYLSVFLSELANSASILIPTPGTAYTLSLSVILNPFLLGLAGGVGAALGELTGYFAGSKGRRILEGRRVFQWFQALAKRRVGPALFVIAALPVPFDGAGLWAGAVRYPAARFLLCIMPGKMVKITCIALAGHYGLAWLLGPLA
jgi:membrane protein YqaA with SNARE-associated domain